MKTIVISTMKGFSTPFLRLLFVFFFTLSINILLTAQMESVVNSLADDEFAHPWDNPDTPVDESIDGICGDENGRCTLRAALEEASLLGTSARVTFSPVGVIFVDSTQGPFFPPSGSLVQGYNHFVAIYGYPTGIIFYLENSTLVSGLIMDNALVGIVVSGNHNRIGLSTFPEANYISDMIQNGILITGDSNRVTGNIIGPNTIPIPTADSPFGIFVTGKDNVIGGAMTGEGNVISENDIGIGVYTIEGNTYIFGNKIGTDITGTQALPNRIGVDVIGPNTYIGSGLPGGMNVISGNTESGILMGIDADSNFILANHIGVDSSGTIPIPNRDGITLGPGSTSVLVQDNLIAHNTSNGILISGFGGLESGYHAIQGNDIIRNGNVGVFMNGASNHNVIGSSLTGDFDANEIKQNGSAGVMFLGGIVGDPEQNTIRKNIFQDNSLIGIRIWAGQGAIQPPSVQTFIDDGTSTVVLGKHPVPGAVIDVYVGDANASNVYEGLEWFAQGIVDGQGEFNLNTNSCNCDTIVLTATDPLGNTSEFSAGFGIIIDAVQDQDNFLDELSISPNPFNTSTSINFTLTGPQDVSLKIFDLTGKEIKTLVDDHLLSGMHQFNWMPENQIGGLYYFRLASKSGKQIFGKIIKID